MVTILQVFYSVFSGVLLSLAIPNEFYLLGFPWLSLIALIPYYLSFRLAKNYRFAFLGGFLQTVATHLCSSFWLAHFKDFAILTIGGSALGTGIQGGAIGLLFYLPYAAKKELEENSLSVKFFNSSSFKILYFAATYTIWEWLKSSGFLGYPWGTVAGTMYNWPIFMQLAAITGTYGITFIFALLNAFLAEGFIYITNTANILCYHQKEDLIICSHLIALLFGVTFVYGVYQCDLTRIPDRTISTIIVQQNSDPWKERTDRDSILNSQKLTDEQYEKLMQEGKKPELIVWCEGTLNYPLPRNLNHYNRSPVEKPLIEFIKEKNTPLLTGGSWLKDPVLKKYNNAAIVFDKEGNLRGMYGKNHLVPCAEALPGIEYPLVREFMEKVIHISAGWTPGDQYAYFDIPCSYNPNRILPAVVNYDISKPFYEQQLEESKSPTVKISTPVCFDDCFPDIMGPLFKNGAEVFMNITNDSWSLTNSSEYQHFVNASYSAIEYRTTLVRCCNAGYSVVLDPTGKVLADLPLFERTAMTYDVPIYNRIVTTYARFGNWLPYLLLLFIGFYSFYRYFTFLPDDYIPSERKIKKGKKSKKHSRSK